MIEDFAGREWADNHQRFSDDIVRAFKALWRGFERLNAAQFDAPWTRATPHCKTAR